MEIDRYIGIPYSARHMDCADLAAMVQHDLFGRTVLLARPRPMRSDQQAQVIAAYCGELGTRTDTPRDGDAVLMRDTGAAMAGHLGTYFFINYAPHVLHTSHTLGGSRLHRIQELSAYGLQLEGFYAWK